MSSRTGSDEQHRAVAGAWDRRELAAVALGGVAGALLRVWLSRRFATGDGWPWATFSINVSGAFALACFVTRLQERIAPTTYLRPLLGTGFCGAYTTFSTMQVELLRMLEASRYGLATGYAAASIAAGCGAVWLGTALVRRTRRLL